MRKVKLNILFIFINGFLTQSTRGLSPVIFIPGNGGNQLEARLNKTESVNSLCRKTSNKYCIWLNLEIVAPLARECWVDNMRLVYDNITRTTRNPPGVDIMIPGWSTPEPVEWLDSSSHIRGAYFNTIADALVKIGYVRNVSIKGAPYDFRKAPNENGDFFVKLRTLVEDTYANNNESPVTFITHSMGGLMATQFLRLQSREWKDQYIKRIIALSTPWAGSVKAVKVYAIGDNLGSRLVDASVMRTQMITSPSLAWLLPSSLFWKPTEVLVQTDKFNYTANDFEKLFTDMELPNAWEMRKDTLKYAQDFSAPGVELHCLYGYNLSTVDRLVYKPGAWPDGYPKLIRGDGDGTVNLRSLKVCENWRKPRFRLLHSNGKKMVKSVPFRGAQHNRILHDQRVIDYVTLVMNLN